MPSAICNKEITINGKKKNYWNCKNPFIRFFSSESIGKHLKQCKQIN